MKKFIPNNIKLNVRLIKRTIQDILTGHYFDYATNKNTEHKFAHTLTLKQALKPNEAKKKNLLIAIKHIESIQIKPNQIFSFWKAIGKPSQKKGFVNSRSIVNGKVKESLGGGLCQLSGLIYYISLHANLKILERHNHSIDIYTDKTRFTPLGSDATVAFGYKDLKIRNTLKSPIRYTFSIVDNDLIINLQHSTIIKQSNIEFKEKKLPNGIIEVDTIIDNQVVNTSSYKKYN